MQFNERDIQAVLFDLDGTLIDTAPDLAAALNSVLVQQGLEELPYESIRPFVSYGAAGLIRLGFGNELSTEQHTNVKSELIAYYQNNIANQSSLFQGLDTAISHLEKNAIKWGIVTNKPEYLTTPLLKSLNLYNRADCIVSGDQVSNPKPHPESIHLACKLINIPTNKTIYLGDAKRDIQAGKQAGLATVACQFGYIPPDEDINSWQADKIVDTSVELSDWLMTLN